MDFWCSSSRHLEIFAAQPVPKPLAPHRSPDFAGLLAIEREQIVHGANAFFVQALLSARADAGQIAQGELVQRLGQNVERQRHKAVGLFHVAGDFCEIAIGGEPHGAAQAFAGLFADCCFDADAKVESRHASGRSRPIRRQAISSMEQTAVTGTQLSTASTTR